MALYQVLKEGSPHGNTPAVISLPNGVKSVQKMSKYVKSFANWKEIVLVFDMDGPGQAAVDAFCKIYPEALVAKLPLKDAHDMLMAGREKELYAAVMFNPKRKLSDKLVRSSDLWDKAGVRPEEGISWAWPELTSLPRS